MADNLRSELLALGVTSWYDAKDLDNTGQHYLSGGTVGQARPRRPARALTARHYRPRAWKTAS
jgi:hypothetical protein